MDTAAVFERVMKSYEGKNYGTEDSLVLCGDSLELMKFVPDRSIELILTDPPYHSTKKKNIVGDIDFEADEDFIAWMKLYAAEWGRVLMCSGSIFCFCSSEMSARLQMMFSEFFNVLSEITWTKPNAQA